jgi:hypothetical protein
MKHRILIIIPLLIVGALLFSCGTNQTEQPAEQVDANAIRTEAVATYASFLTETLVAQSTPLAHADASSLRNRKPHRDHHNGGALPNDKSLLQPVVH